MLNGIFVCEDMKYWILEGLKGFKVKDFNEGKKIN